MKTEKIYRTDDVAAISGATARQLQWWDEHGIISAGRYQGDRVYSRTQALCACIAVEMRARNVYPRVAWAAVRQFLSMPFRSGYLIVDYNGLKVVHATSQKKAIEAAIKLSGPVVILSLKGISSRL